MSSSGSDSPAAPAAAAALRPSGRKGSRKVRTGCITCKVRKVKCDETRPFCLRCVKTGRRCDGYRPDRSPRSDSMGLSLSPTPEFESPTECRAFDYYRKQSGPALGGAVDCGFWADTVLRLSLAEPAVRHAVLALSGLHEYESVKARTGREISRTFAFQEYGRAMSVMMRWDPRGEPAAIPLLVCVLFTCIEFLLDHETASQLHIGQGREILSGLEESHSPKMDIIKAQLVPLYSRLGLTSFLFGRVPAAIPNHLRTSPSLPVDFSSFHEARGHLYFLLDEALRFSREAKPAVYDPDVDPTELSILGDRQQRMLSKLGQWNAAFAVIVSLSQPDASWTTTQNVLRMYYHASVVWVSTALDPLECAYDAHMESFASIISLAASILGSQTSMIATRSFSFESELLAPVYWTVVKCRHPSLRRAALKLLMRDELRERQENLWCGREILAASLRIVQLEEAGPNSSAGEPTTSRDSDGFESETTIPRQVEWFEGELSIPLTRPPNTKPPIEPVNLPLDEQGEALSEDEVLRYITRGETDGSRHTVSVPTQPPSSPSLEVRAREAPFGVPELHRLRNVDLGPRLHNGVWMTSFRTPQPGEEEWKVAREFLTL